MSLARFVTPRHVGWFRTHRRVVAVAFWAVVGSSAALGASVLGVVADRAWSVLHRAGQS